MQLKKRAAFANILKRNNRGQIWVETVIYTLIAFTLMGLVLAFVLPKIQETQDKGVIDQSIGVLQDMDSMITNLGGPGNQRVPEIAISKGSLTIDGINDLIYFKITSKYQYSEPGSAVTVGKILAETQTQDNTNVVTLILSYSGEYNITYSGKDAVKTLNKAAVPYNLVISSAGTNSTGTPIINLAVEGE